jgi:hypothetical protein
VQRRHLEREGETSRPIPVQYAHLSYEQAVNSFKRQLRVFTPEEGATEHIGLDHLPTSAAASRTGSPTRSLPGERPAGWRPW